MPENDVLFGDRFEEAQEPGIDWATYLSVFLAGLVCFCVGLAFGAQLVVYRVKADAPGAIAALRYGVCRDIFANKSDLETLCGKRP